MSGESFEHSIYTDKSVQDAYRELVDNALHEYGHGDYNGTISTTSGVTVVQSPPLTLAQAEELATTRIDDLRTGGHCEAIPLVEETLAQYEIDDPVEVDVDVTAEVFRTWELMRQHLATLVGRPVDDVFGRQSIHGTVKTTERVRSVVTKGAAETRFFVIGAGAWALPQWEKGHPTQDAAEAAMTGIKPDPASFGVRAVQVIAITRRVDGQPLVTGTVTVTVEHVNARMEVKLRRKVTDAKVGTRQAGWYIYGSAVS